jgi:L,D-transpeptidase catalytic domain
MPRFVIAIVTLAALLGPLARAEAGIVVTVDKSAQRLSVAVDGFERYEWPVSTARWGYRTPNGTYRPGRLERKWFSRKYDWSPMPYSIFFDGGYAIHGSYEIRHLGSPASHGCIRLHPQHAAILFALVKEHIGDTRIVVIGERLERDVRHQRARRERSERHERASRHRKTRRARSNFEDVFNAAPDEDAGDASRGRWIRQ